MHAHEYLHMLAHEYLISMARLATGLAILTGYPFAFSALREGILDLNNITDKQRRDSAIRPLTVGLLSVVTALALILKDVGFIVVPVLSACSIPCDAILMLIVPVAMNIANIKNKGDKATKGEKREVFANYGVAVVGTLMAILGAMIGIPAFIFLFAAVTGLFS
jgi:hypothetical protein